VIVILVLCRLLLVSTWRRLTRNATAHFGGGRHLLVSTFRKVTRNVVGGDVGGVTAGVGGVGCRHLLVSTAEAHHMVHSVWTVLVYCADTIIFLWAGAVPEPDLQLFLSICLCLCLCVCLSVSMSRCLSLCMSF